MYTHPEEDTPVSCLEVTDAGFDALRVSIDWSGDQNKDDNITDRRIIENQNEWWISFLRSVKLLVRIVI